MDPVLITLIFGGIGAIMVAATWAAVARGHVVGRWNLSTTYILLLAWVLMAASAFVQFTGGYVSFIGALGTLIVLPNDRANQISQYGTIAIIVISAIFIALGLLRRPALNRAGLLGVFLVILTDLAATIWGDSTFGAPRIIALILMFFAATVLPRGDGARLGIALAGISISVVSCLLVIVDFGNAFRACRADKCGVLGNLFFGVTTGENVLGALLTACIPAVFLAFRGAARWWLTGSIVAIVVLGGSRTSLQGVIVLVLILVVTRITVDQEPRRWVTVGIGGVMILGMALAAAIPLLTTDPAAYTNRASLWILARSEMVQSWLIGFGGLHWGLQVAIGQVTPDQAYSVHNQILDITYASGIVGLIAFTLLIAIAIQSTSRQQRAVSFLMLMPMVYIGIFERLWAFGVLDVWGWLAPATLLALGSTYRDGSSDQVSLDLTDRGLVEASALRPRPKTRIGSSRR